MSSYDARDWDAPERPQIDPTRNLIAAAKAAEREACLKVIRNHRASLESVCRPGMEIVPVVAEELRKVEAMIEARGK